jgi:hypothetical protein
LIKKLYEHADEHPSDDSDSKSESESSVSSYSESDSESDEKSATYDKKLGVWVADGFAFTDEEVAFGKIKTHGVHPLTKADKRKLKLDCISVWEECDTRELVNKACEKVKRKYEREKCGSSTKHTKKKTRISTSSSDEEVPAFDPSQKKKKTNKYKKYNTLVIGLDSNSSIGVVKSTTLYTGTKNNYTLDWFDLTQTKHVPEETFSTIIVHDTKLLNNSRILHNVIRTLKYEGMLCCNQKMANLSSNGLSHTGRSGFQLDKKMIYYERYERGETTDGDPPDEKKGTNAPGTPGTEKKKKRKPQKYKAVSIDIDMCYEAVGPKMGITLEQFREEIDNPEFIERYTKSQEKFMAYKKKFYTKKLTEFQKEARNTGSKFSDMMSGGEGKHVQDIKDILKVIGDHVQEIGSEKTKENLTDALENEEKGLAAITGREDIKQEIVTMLYSFGNQYSTLTNSFQNMAFLGSAGVGKCVKIDTPILMYDGTVKMVQDIINGDVLMGDDSTPRNVLSITSGKERMYRVVPVKGDSYTVNESHIISLITSYSPRVRWIEKEGRYKVVWRNEEGKSHSKSFAIKVWGTKELAFTKASDFRETCPTEAKIDIPITKYISMTASQKKEWKGYRVGVEFPEVETALDPYLLGLWLGDGWKDCPVITNIDSEVINYLYEIANKMTGLNLIPRKNHPSYSFTSDTGRKRANMFLNELQDQNLICNKHIPLIYKCNSREKRLRLLAGLIDTDGSLSNNCYDIIQKSKTLTDDILYLARSLGFAAHTKECQKSCTYKGEKKTGTYWRTTISGNIIDIPVLIPRKKANPRKQIKDPLKTGLTVEKLDVGKYYGFEIDGNHRFLLGDFTVTHNTFSANVLAYVFCKAGILATDTFCPVTRTDLVAGYIGQTAPMTRKKLIETLEGVLFIDECYQLCQVDGGSRDFGNESLAEIVNFIDKYIGMSIIIVAGYEAPMMEKFFPSNEGMLRRFPHRFVLQPYTNEQLSDILLNFVEEKTETQIDRKTGNIIFTMISKVQEKYPDAFQNQAGDMLNLGGDLSKSMLSLYGKNWRDCKKEVILDAFNRYLAPKKMGITLNEDSE